MAQAPIQNRAFYEEDAAREALEAVRWPDGPSCPHCGNLDREKIAKGQGKVHRPGLYYCAACNGQFTVTVGTVMERSKIPLSKWLFAMHLMGASKKGMSALQLSRMLGVTYKTAWFLCHRIREAMTPDQRGPIGGANKVVESDETYIGGKAKNRAFAKKEPKKHAVLALVDRDGNSYSFHIANVKADTLRETINKAVDSKSHLMTDELLSYGSVGKQFAGHSTVNHSADEYVRLGGFAHINTAECRFSLMKRAVFGTHHSISEAHLSRYLAEWDFKFNTRKMNDGERATLIAKGLEGKRLTYRPTDGNHQSRSVH
ncbi:IS1595 family transposase (plasmid) [Mesorhizobium sp. AR07]|uniref:IS1595 family transposase n=1 Tax=Mesorhizobium sp. AR07 TaxID=2865838 RepID=UPI00215EB84F|nr:IS1595 family transposase [Mesorhizobium sp. AR07]UVK48789.1 IS1595 family transposase [Mesorhizobium sp. AR07]